MEIVWWKDAGYEWQSIYRFFTAGAPFWWNLCLSLLGGVLSLAYWRNGDRPKWWGLPGLLIASMWAARMAFGFLVLAVKWLLNQFATDIVDASLPKKRRRKRKPKRRRNSQKSDRSKRRRGSKGKRRNRRPGRPKGRRSGGRGGRRRGRSRRRY